MVERGVPATATWQGAVSTMTQHKTCRIMMYDIYYLLGSSTTEYWIQVPAHNIESAAAIAYGMLLREGRQAISITRAHPCSIH